MKKLICLALMMMLTGCATSKNHFAVNDEIERAEEMVRLMSNVKSPDELVAEVGKEASKKMNDEMDAFEYVAQKMATLDCPMVAHMEHLQTREALMNEMLTEDDKISEGWVFAFVELIKQYNYAAKVKVTPRKGLLIIPGESVHLTVKTGLGERSYIIAPMSRRYLLCEE